LLRNTIKRAAAYCRVARARPWSRRAEALFSCSSLDD
jgi:hypothetical protein